MSEGDAFKRSSKLAHSPTADSGFINSIGNLTKNLELIEQRANESKNEASTVQPVEQINNDKAPHSRRSVSFSLPAGSSTFRIPNNDDLDHSTASVLSDSEAEGYITNSSAAVDQLIGETRDLFQNFSIRNQETDPLDPNRFTATYHGESLLNPYWGAESTFSQLNKSNQSDIFISDTGVNENTVALSDSTSLNQNSDSISNSTNSQNQQLSESIQLQQTAVDQTFKVINDQNDQNDTTEYGESREDEMALNISSILSGIDKFSSNSQEEIKQFIANCDLYYELAENNQKEIVLKVIRTRLVAVPKLGKIDTLTWNEIKTKIQNAFKRNDIRRGARKTTRDKAIFK